MITSEHQSKQLFPTLAVSLYLSSISIRIERPIAQYQSIYYIISAAALSVVECASKVT